MTFNVFTMMCSLLDLKGCKYYKHKIDTKKDKHKGVYVELVNLPGCEGYYFKINLESLLLLFIFIFKLSNSFPAPFCLTSPFSTYFVCDDTLDSVSHFLGAYFIFFPLCFSDCVISINLFSSL